MYRTDPQDPWHFQHALIAGHAEMTRGRACADGTETQRAGFRLRKRDQFFEIAHRQRRVNHQHAGPGGDKRHRHEIADRVERQPEVEARVDRE